MDMLTKLLAEADCAEEKRTLALNAGNDEEAEYWGAYEDEMLRYANQIDPDYLRG